jgi:hypothetical protein
MRGHEDEKFDIAAYHPDALEEIEHRLKSSPWLAIDMSSLEFIDSPSSAPWCGPATMRDDNGRRGLMGPGPRALSNCSSVHSSTTSSPSISTQATSPGQRDRPADLTDRRTVGTRRRQRPSSARSSPTGQTAPTPRNR